MSEFDCPIPGQQGSPVLTASLTVLRTNFDEAFPNRDKSTDGWIGDSAHQQTTSGHNPDDTAGSKAEYSDSDSKAEVRAIDVDDDLECPGVTMQDVIDEILSTPNDLKRLKYIIYNNYIWSKSDGWVRENYTGSNSHTAHAHFSGDPAYDEDTSVWSVAYMGEVMTDAQAYKQHVMNYRVDAIVHARTQVNIPDFTAPGGSEYAGYTEQCELGQFLREILGIVEDSPPGGASPEQIAQATADELAERLVE